MAVNHNRFFRIELTGPLGQLPQRDQPGALNPGDLMLPYLAHVEQLNRLAGLKPAAELLRTDLYSQVVHVE